MSVEGAAGRALPAYRARIARRLAWLAAAAAGLLALGDVLTGPARLDLGAVLGSGGAGRRRARVVTIVWDIRLPMTLMAMVVGPALSVAGAAMQTLLGNPLASPYTLGFSAAAGFGAALALLLGVSLPWLPWLTVPVAAFAGTALAALLVYGLSRLRAMTAETMVLAGIATLFIQSAQSLVQYLAAPEVLRATFWLFGAAQGSWDNLPISAGILALGAALAPVVWQRPPCGSATRGRRPWASMCGACSRLCHRRPVDRRRRRFRWHHRLHRPGGAPYRAHAGRRRTAVCCRWPA